MTKLTFMQTMLLFLKAKAKELALITGLFLIYSAIVILFYAGDFTAAYICYAFIIFVAAIMFEWILFNIKLEINVLRKSINREFNSVRGDLLKLREEREESDRKFYEKLNSI